VLSATAMEVATMCSKMTFEIQSIYHCYPTLCEAYINR
jgi:hypothetical protein